MTHVIDLTGCEIMSPSNKERYVYFFERYRDLMFVLMICIGYNLRLNVLTTTPARKKKFVSFMTEAYTPMTKIEAEELFTLVVGAHCYRT